MDNMSNVAETVHKICLKNFSEQFDGAKVDARTDSVWDKVRSTKTRLWLDTGDIDAITKLWHKQFEALTTNNTLINREVQKGIYDTLIAEVASTIKQTTPRIDEQRLLLEVSFVLNAYHGLGLADIFDAYVSLELHTDLGNDVAGSVIYGKRYHAICPEKFYVKVPLTPAGLLAARKLGKSGIPVNLTLGFSARQNYAAALIAQPSYVNVFLGRLNAVVAKNDLGDGLNVGEKTTIATQKELLKLREQKRTNTLLIAASMRNSKQITALAGVDVYTIPPKVAEEYVKSPTEEITQVLPDDMEISLAPQVTYDDFNASTLWDVPETFKDCVEQLLAKDVDSMTSDDMQAHFAQAGLAGIFPKWSEQDIETITADGKIPVYEKWKDRLSAGTIGLDALMNISAFYSFATDQKMLDDRIKSLL